MLSTRFNEAISKSASIVLVFNILDVYIKASASLTSYRYHHVDSLPVASLFLFAFSRYVHDFFMFCSPPASCTRHYMHIRTFLMDK